MKKQVKHYESHTSNKLNNIKAMLKKSVAFFILKKRRQYIVSLALI